MHLGMQIEGYVTGFGQPTWRKTHSPAKATAPAVQALHLPLALVKLMQQLSCLVRSHFEQEDHGVECMMSDIGLQGLPLPRHGPMMDMPCAADKAGSVVLRGLSFIAGVARRWGNPCWDYPDG